MEWKVPRRRPRTKIRQSVRVRPSDPKDPNFEEVQQTLNASREGLYFATKRGSYYVGMRLFITFPYSSPTDPINCEYIGEVLRVEQLGNSRYGIAVHLLSTINMVPSTGSVHSQRK